MPCRPSLPGFRPPRLAWPFPRRSQFRKPPEAQFEQQEYAIREASTLIAVISAVVALVGMLLASRSARLANDSSDEANRIQAAMLDLMRDQEQSRVAESQKTAWTCSLERGRNEGSIRIRNDGPATARGVRIMFNNRPVKDFNNVSNRHNGVHDEVRAGSEIVLGINALSALVVRA